jgi:hypothetical protein
MLQGTTQVSCIGFPEASDPLETLSLPWEDNELPRTQSIPTVLINECEMAPSIEENQVFDFLTTAS